MMSLSVLLFCYLKAKENSPLNSLWIVPSPGRGYNMYIHEAEQLIPGCSDKSLFHPAARFRDQKKFPPESSLDESYKVTFRSTTKSQLVYVTENFTPLLLIWLLNVLWLWNAKHIYQGQGFFVGKTVIMLVWVQFPTLACLSRDIHTSA